MRNLTVLEDSVNEDDFDGGTSKTAYHVVISLLLLETVYHVVH